MNTKRWGLASIGIAAFAGFWLIAELKPTQAFAQAERSAMASPARFQVSAWGFGSDAGRGERGCYIVDTTTGELWVAHADGAAKKLSEKLK